MRHRGTFVLAVLIVALAVVLPGAFVLQAVAGPLYAPPPPPTGPAPTRMPTDVYNPAVDKLPTRALWPGEKTSVAPTQAPFFLPTDQPLNPVTPAPNAVLYRDPVLGFTLQYPANWQVDAEPPPQSPASAQITGVRIRNYNNVVRKGGFSPDQLTIDIIARSELPQYGTLDNWVAKRPLYQDATYGPRKEIKVANVRALSWNVTGPTAPEGDILVALAQGKWVYLISAYPATSKHLATFNQVVSSLRIP